MIDDARTCTHSLTLPWVPCVTFAFALPHHLSMHIQHPIPINAQFTPHHTSESSECDTYECETDCDCDIDITL
jgi:hypothetical protein